MREKDDETGTAPGKLIRALVEPPRDVVDAQRRRQMRLLSALLLVILLVGGVSGLVQLLIVPGFLATFKVIAGALVALSIAYALARTRHYPMAAVLACLTPAVASYAGLLANPSDQSAFVFLLIGVLLSSMLLDLKWTLGFAGLNLIGLLALPLLESVWAPSVVAGKLSFHILIPALIVLAMKQRDLMERDRREELLQSELKFRSIFDSSVDAIGVSRVGIHVMANPAYLRMFGYESTDQLAGTPILDLIAPSEHARIADNVQRRLEGGTVPAHYETRGRRRDGAEFDMEVHVSIYEMRGERYTVAILRDITERKQAERILEESERRFREMLQGVGLAGVMLDQAGRVTFINDFLLRATSWSREETLGRDWVGTFVPPEIREKVRSVLDQLNHGGALAPSYENEILTRDGERRLIHWSNAVLADSSGRAVGTASIGEDVTERRRIEEAWRSSEHRYRMLFEANPHPMWVYDLESFAFLTVNDAAVAKYGYSRDDFARMTIRDIRPSEDIPRLLSYVGNPTRGVDEAGYWRHRLKDGAIIDVEITSHAFTFDGRAAELVLANDITERLRAQRDLEENRRRLAFLLAKSPSVVYSARVDGTFGATFVAENVTRQLGYQPEDFTADPKFWLNRLHPDDVSRVLSDLERLPQEGALTYEYRFLNQEGRYIWMRDEMALIRDPSGKPLEIVGAWIDVTHRREAEAEREALIRELTEKNSELTRFTYTVSHDLKSPLVTISGFLGQVAQDAASGNLERLGQDIHRIRNAVGKMGRLLNDLLELSRVGRSMKDPESFPFEELATQALELVHGRLEERGVKVQIQPDLPTVRGDRARLTQLLQNLLENAAKFMGDQTDPRVDIGQISGEVGQAVFFVRDNGIGMAARHHERVFGLFDKLDKGSDGTGVGLALVKRIVEVHSGRIWVESEEGKGATFFFTLPAGSDGGPLSTIR